MKTKTDICSAGRIPFAWMRDAIDSVCVTPRTLPSEKCFVQLLAIEDWFRNASNYAVEISPDRTIWNSSTGAWLSQEQIDRLCELIDLRRLYQAGCITD